MIDRKYEDFICDRYDFKKLCGSGMVVWVSGKPFLENQIVIGKHRIRIPGTRFA